MGNHVGVSEASTDAGPFFHGTKADLQPGDLLAPGHGSNFGTRVRANFIYLTATLDAATWGAELAAGDAPGRIYRVEPRRFATNLAEFTELLDLGDLLDTPVRQLSLGQRMRGDIAAALLHDPEILYLDEPTIGLDVISKGRLREFLRTVNATRGTTLMLTTHDLQDIEALCRRVMVIDKGSLVYDGSLHGLHEQGSSSRTLVVDLVDQGPPIDVPGVVVERVEGPRQWLSFPAGASAAPVVAAVAASYAVADLSIQEPDIEQVIKQLYERS